VGAALTLRGRSLRWGGGTDAEGPLRGGGGAIAEGAELTLRGRFAAGAVLTQGVAPGLEPALLISRFAEEIAAPSASVQHSLRQFRPLSVSPALSASVLDPLRGREFIPE
jgi:hypothetical protein